MDIFKNLQIENFKFVFIFKVFWNLLIFVQSYFITFMFLLCRSMQYPGNLEKCISFVLVFFWRCGLNVNCYLKKPGKIELFHNDWKLLKIGYFIRILLVGNNLEPSKIDF